MNVAGQLDPWLLIQAAQLDSSAPTPLLALVDASSQGVVLLPPPPIPPGQERLSVFELMRDGSIVQRDATGAPVAVFRQGVWLDDAGTLAALQRTVSFEFEMNGALVGGWTMIDTTNGQPVWTWTSSDAFAVGCCGDGPFVHTTQTGGVVISTNSPVVNVWLPAGLSQPTVTTSLVTPR